MRAAVRLYVTGLLETEGHNGSSGGTAQLSKVTGRCDYRDIRFVRRRVGALLAF